MKKFAILLLVFFLMSFSAVFAAEDGPYVGVGIGYGFPLFDFHDPYGFGIDHNGATAIHLKGGYKFQKNLAFEIGADFYQAFEWKEIASINKVNVSVADEVNTSMLIWGFKGIIESAGSMGGYIMPSLGYIWVNESQKSSVYNPGFSESKDDRGLCAKITVGATYSVSEYISLYAEGGYIYGLGGASAIRLPNVSTGVMINY